MIYLLLFLILIALRFSKVRGLYPFVMAFLFLLSAFRFEVGCDWYGYLNHYWVYGPMTLEESLGQREPLWVTFFIGQTYLGLPYPWINVLSSAIFFYGIHKLASRQPNPLAFLVLLFPVMILNMPMSAIRQGAAIGLMCLAFVSFIDRRLIRFVILTAIATLIHSSSMTFLLLAPLVQGKYSLRRFILAGILAIPGAVFLAFSDSGTLATGRYFNTDTDANGALFRVGLLALAAAMHFIWLRRKWAVSFPLDLKFIDAGALMMLLLFALLSFSSVIADRLGYFLIPIQTMIFARLPYLSLRGNHRLLIHAPYVILLLVLAVWTTFSWHFQQCYLPYQTWIFGFPEATMPFQ